MTGRKPKATLAQIARMSHLRACGLTFDRIAREFGLARSTVRRYLAGECRHYRGP
jgi:predicted transcriptional regulator